MSVGAKARSEDRWSEDDAAWRDPEGVMSGRRYPQPIDRELLDMKVSGDWWGVLERLDACLVVSREYEHLLLALTMAPEGPRQSFMSLPHPSGLSFDAHSERLHVASTRNPNQLYELAPTVAADSNGHGAHAGERSLAPMSVSFLPGRLYLHDIALIGGVLHGSAAGLNAVVRLAGSSGWEVVWWPSAIERDGRPDLSRNYLQLNSIAAGEDLSSSFFSASTDAPSKRRPGHRNFPVDRRGVIFSGATREPIARGLTRPHSARLHRNELWVDDSGYGHLAKISAGEPLPVTRLPGWTRGLTFAGDIAFVGTSRVIPRFARYAPGLDVERSVCAVHALDTLSGEVLGSARWPAGNQIFDIAVLPRSTTLGFPTVAGRRQSRRAIDSFFFSYKVPNGVGVT
ncbi:MAG TPA: DUF4915 domain-containing protein [Solirubrobacteraceae bacterium]|nr:DUF4915 domain-containing protein [Solirubrobacteraceae bacterium]